MKWKLTELTSIRAFFQFEFLIAASILFRVLNSSYEFWLSKESYEHHKSDLSKDIDREETIGTHSLSDDMNRTTKQSGMEVFQKTKKHNIGPNNPTSKYLAKRIRREVSRCLSSHVQGSLVLNGQERNSSKTSAEWGLYGKSVEYWDSALWKKKTLSHCTAQMNFRDVCHVK